MDVLWIPAGLVVVLVVLLDAVRTTLGVGSGPGPLTRLITVALWRLGRHPRVFRSLPLRAIGGPGVLVVASIFAVWVGLLWTGWSLVMLGNGHAVVTSQDHSAATTWQRFYLAGYSVVTLGNGSYRPSGAGSELATVGAALTGMMVITLAISYLTQVVGAVVAKRRFAAEVLSWGDGPVDVASALVTGGAGATVATTLSAAAGALTGIVQQHQAYPLLHAYRPVSREHGPAPAVAVLVDTVLLLDAAIEPGRRPPLATVRSVLSAAGEFVDVAPGFGDAEPVPAPRLGTALTDVLPIDDDRWQASLDRHGRLRAALHAQSRADGFEVPRSAGAGSGSRS